MSHAIISQKVWLIFFAKRSDCGFVDTQIVLTPLWDQCLRQYAYGPMAGLQSACHNLRCPDAGGPTSEVSVELGVFWSTFLLVMVNLY